LRFCRASETCLFDRLALVSQNARQFINGRVVIIGDRFRPCQFLRERQITLRAILLGDPARQLHVINRDALAFDTHRSHDIGDGPTGASHFYEAFIGDWLITEVPQFPVDRLPAKLIDFTLETGSCLQADGIRTPAGILGDGDPLDISLGERFVDSDCQAHGSLQVVQGCRGVTVDLRDLTGRYACHLHIAGLRDESHLLGASWLESPVDQGVRCTQFRR
jgi:hypothetical protein